MCVSGTSFSISFRISISFSSSISCVLVFLEDFASVLSATFSYMFIFGDDVSHVNVAVLKEMESFCW